MIIKIIEKISYQQVLIINFLFSFCALVLVYISQYFFDLLPCILCIYQRIPLAIILITIIISLILATKKISKKINQQIIKKLSLAIITLSLLSNVILSFYHSGVERKIFKMTTKCQSDKSLNPQDLEQLRAMIANAKLAKCDDISFSFLKLSMANWNLIFTLGLLTLVICFILKNYCKKKNYH